MTTQRLPLDDYINLLQDDKHFAKKILEMVVGLQEQHAEHIAKNLHEKTYYDLFTLTLEKHYNKSEINALWTQIGGKPFDKKECHCTIQTLMAIGCKCGSV